MPRRSLKPQLNQIRAWVQQGRTDAWIAHQLEVSATELREFRKQYDLSAEEGSATSEVDLRDEIEAEIEAAAEQDEAEEGEGEQAEAEAEAEEGEEEEGEEESEGGAGGAGSGRRRRGGRGRRKELEASFDHGETDGYGLWLDASVKDDPVYKEHWAGKRDVTVRIEAEQIVIKRAGSSGNGDGEEDSDD
jgi:hypothetical protein